MVKTDCGTDGSFPALVWTPGHIKTTGQRRLGHLSGARTSPWWAWCQPRQQGWGGDTGVGTDTSRRKVSREEECTGPAWQCNIISPVLSRYYNMMTLCNSLYLRRPLPNVCTAVTSVVPAQPGWAAGNAITMLQKNFIRKNFLSICICSGHGNNISWHSVR